MAKTLVHAAMLGMVLVAMPLANAQQPGSAAEPQTPASPPALMQRPSPTAPSITIGPGDMIEATVFDAPELSSRLRVDAHGDVNAPLIGMVHVEGLTAEQAGALISDRYVEAQILRPESAQASVFIEEYANQGITVNGEVKAPGVYPALGVRMLNDVVSSAGGETPIAASTVLITHRSDPQHTISVDYDPSALKPVIPAVQILPGDSITVPRAGIVYVVGDVNKPGGYILDGRQPLTVEEAMGLAGGGGHAAKLRRVQLLRSLDDGRKEMIIVPVNKIMEGKDPDVALRDGDILYVPTSTGRLVMEQAITSAIGIGTSVTVYRTAYQ